MTSRGAIRLVAIAVVCSAISFAALADTQPGVLGGAQPDDAISTARQLINKGLYKEAEAELRTGGASHAASPVWHSLLAYILLRENKPAESLAEYTRAAQLHTPSPEDLKNVALDYVLLSDYASADKWMSQSLNWDDKNADSWYVLGRIRYSSGNMLSAVACFQRALSLAPRSVKAENNLGLTYEGLNRTEDAIAAYRTAISWQQNMPSPSEQPLLNLAIVLAHEEHLDEAVQLLVDAARIAPKDPKIRQQLGQLYLKRGQLREAQQEVQQAVALSPDAAPYHFLLGRVYQQQGLVAQARTEFDRAAALYGTHSTP